MVDALKIKKREERLLYKTRFNLPDQSICSMSLNEEGFREMNNTVMCCLERMLDLKVDTFGP